MIRSSLTPVFFRFSLGLFVLLVVAAPAGAVVIYDESVSGDLPDVGLGPVLNLVQGPDSEVKGDLVPPADPTDKFQFVVPPGFKVDDIIVESQPVPEDPNAFGFFLFEIEIAPLELPGNSIVVIIPAQTPPGGTSLKDAQPVSPIPSPLEDLLPFIPSPEPYRIKLSVDEDPLWSVTFLTSPIPEPACIVLCATSGLVLVCRRRR